MSNIDHTQTEATECGTTPSASTVEVIVNRLLLDGWWAPQWLYDGILEHVREIIPAMEPAVLYTLEDLAGPDYWKTLSKGDRRTGGRCAHDMIKRGLLPEIEVGEIKRTRPLRYRLATR